MPRVHQARAVDELEPELMDMDEVVAAAAKLEAAAKVEAEQEEMITVSTVDYRVIQQALAGIRFELADMQRDAH
jgi:hypothetical protein